MAFKMKGMNFGEGTGSALKKDPSKTRLGDKISSAARALTSSWMRGESVKAAYNKNKQADRTARRLGYEPSEMERHKYNAIRRGDKVETKEPKTVEEAFERSSRNRVQR